MEVNSTKTPLLWSKDHEAEIQKPKVASNVSTMKSNFFTDLPHKLRSKIDPGDPFDIDISKAVGLKKGIHTHNFSVVLYKLDDILTKPRMLI